MITLQTERTLLDVSIQIGSVAESNCRFTYLLAAQVDKATKPLGDFRISEFLALVEKCTKEYNGTPADKTSLDDIECIGQEPASDNADKECASPRFAYRREVKSPAHRLSFVTITKGKGPSSRIDWFDVPLSGDYLTDCTIGRQCAIAYLKVLRTRSMEDPCDLQRIVLSLLPENHPKQDVIVNFFWALEEWIQWAVTYDGAHLDAISEEEIEEKVNALLEQVRHHKDRRSGGRAR